MHSKATAAAPLTDLGTLLVRVSTAGIFQPVEGADVRISGAEEGNREIRYLLTTDQSGLAKRILLPTPAAALSQSPGNVAGYAVYTVAVFKEGFYPLLFKEVPLFPGVTATQQAELIPKPLYEPERYPPTGELIFTEQEPLFEEVD